MKYALVTGASRGIGRETALLLAASGYYVYANYNSSAAEAESLHSLIRERGGNCTLVKADISEETEVEKMFRIIKDTAGRLDVLINNAGICGSRLFTDITREEWERLFAVNVTGAFLCSRYALGLMLPKKSGCIINISSIWGICGASCEVHYSAAKAAVIGMTKALAKEVGPSGITVNCIAPGVIDTDMNACLCPSDLEELKAQSALNCTGKPSDIASLALYLAEKGRFITGQVISPNGGMVI